MHTIIYFKNIFLLLASKINSKFLKQKLKIFSQNTVINETLHCKKVTLTILSFWQVYNHLKINWNANLKLKSFIPKVI
jgi:hypothetical protein